MSVLVKEKMPSKCGECFASWSIYHTGSCVIMERDKWHDHITKLLDSDDFDDNIDSIYDYKPETCPLVEVPEDYADRPKGKWIHQTKFSRIECTNCGQVYRNAFAPKNYCPNCGAEMREEE